MTDDIDLPELPYPPEWVGLNNNAVEYARAAVLADRERRGRTAPGADELEALRRDAARLDSGCIMTHERDEFGMEYKCERRGVDLRAAIDEAMAKQKGGQL